MLAREHSDARCPRCGVTLWYGLTEEATGWKVQYDCLLPEGCGREYNPGRIAFENVRGEDEAYRRAARLGAILY